MKKDASKHIMLTVLACMAAAVVICGVAGRYYSTGGEVTVKRSHWDMDALAKRQLVPAHGKLKPPAEIYVEVTDGGEEGGPVRVTIHAASLVPVQSGTIKIAGPGMGETAERLWSTANPGLVAESVSYTTGALANGLHRFGAAFEFVPERDSAETMIVADSVFLEVRSDTVLSSRVSFDHIRRVELLNELEDRALVSLKPRLATASRKVKDQELAKLAEQEPGAISRKIAQIKANDPDVTRRIKELNRIKDKPGASARGGVAPGEVAGTAGSSRQAQ